MSTETIPHRNIRVPVPQTLDTRIDDTNLVGLLSQDRALLASTRSAVRANAKVLNKLCVDFEQLHTSVNDRLGVVVDRVGRAVERAESALDHAQRLADTCVSKEEFVRMNAQWERRLRRLEAATGEILPPLSENDAGGEQQQQQSTSSSSGALGQFVVRSIEQETARPLADLYEKVTEEWDSAFQNLSDETLKEMSEISSAQRMGRRELLRQLEAAQRDSLQGALDAQTASMQALKGCTVTLAKQQADALSDFGFSIRREVASQLHHTKNQSHVLHRAVIRLRSTLCLPTDEELLRSQSIPTHTAATGFLLSKELDDEHWGSSSNINKSPQHQPSASFSVDSPSWTSEQKQQQQSPQKTQQHQAADFGELRPQAKRQLKQQRREYKKKRKEDDDDDDLSSTTSEDAFEVDPLYESVLMPRGGIHQQPSSSSPIKSAAVVEYKSPAGNSSSNNNPLDVFSQSDRGGDGGGGDNNNNSPHMRPLDRRPSLAADFFQAASTDFDIKSILETPIFAALRDMLLETAKQEIDAQNTIRENQRDTEIEDLRQQSNKKVSIDTVHRLIERSKDRRALEQLDQVATTVKELRSTVIREKEWRSILLSKADFSVVDAVRTQTSARCQSLEEDVRRLERAVVVGFGESLRVAAPRTFEIVEEQRVVDEKERERLYLERGGTDPSVVIKPAPPMSSSSSTPHSSSRRQQEEEGDSEHHSASALSHRPPRGTAEDARSVVVASPRQFLHSAPPSRSSTHQSPQQQQQHRVSSAGRGGSRYFSVGSQQQQQQQQRAHSPISEDGGDTSILYSAYAPPSSVSSSSYSQRTQAATAIKPPRHALIYTGNASPSPSSSCSPSASSARPSSAPRPALVGGGGGGGALPAASSSHSSSSRLPQRPVTAGAVQHHGAPNSSNSGGGDFGGALRTRCRLSDAQVKNW